MTKVITEKDMLQYVGRQKAIFPSGTLLTPAAKDAAAINSITVIVGEADEPDEKDELLDLTIKAVLKNADKAGGLLTRKELVKIVVAGLEQMGCKVLDDQR